MVMSGLIASLIVGAPLFECSTSPAIQKTVPCQTEQSVNPVQGRLDTVRPPEPRLEFARAEEPARSKADRQIKPAERQKPPAPPPKPTREPEEQQFAQDQPQVSGSPLPAIRAALPILTGIWVLFCILFYIVVYGGVGYWIGRPKGRGGAGFLFGLFFAVLGWIVTGLLTPTIAAEAKRQRLVSELLTRRSR